MEVLKYGKNIENYNVTLEEAKKKNIYKFISNMSFSKLKKQIDNNTFNYSDNVPIMIEFGNIDIELSVYSKDDIVFCICAKYEDVEWMTHDYSDTIVNFSISDDKIEEFMFNDLMQYAKKNNLYWSELN